MVLVEGAQPLLYGLGGLMVGSMRIQMDKGVRLTEWLNPDCPRIGAQQV